MQIDIEKKSKTTDQMGAIKIQDKGTTKRLVKEMYARIHQSPPFPTNYAAIEADSKSTTEEF